jgi:hypothetical protein
MMHQYGGAAPQSALAGDRYSRLRRGRAIEAKFALLTLSGAIGSGLGGYPLDASASFSL